MAIWDDSSVDFISIHALLAESDRKLLLRVLFSAVFLSTLSLRRATCCGAGCASPVRYFYPRSPCGERRCFSQTVKRCSCISIHALLAESDVCCKRWKSAIKLISIHALLAESDAARQQGIPSQAHFYPRSPCGERPSPIWCSNHFPVDFYPRSPCGERPM